MKKKTIFSGMRPTGKLHLGHLVGALHNWAELQKEYKCIFGIVDWHALMGEYENSGSIKEDILDMAIDWLSCGIDPKESIIFVQSDVPEHLELQMFFSFFSPLGWLERNPTYKEQLREIKTRDLHTYGFLGYPVLQAADILLYKAQAVPIGEDQLPHIELTREISRRFNRLYKTDIFADCKAILTKTPRLLGLDGRKMSKSYNNTINLSDPKEVVEKKVSTMFTDPKRLRLNDPGHPDVCNVFSYYSVFASNKKDEVCTWCTKAEKGCTDCKKILSQEILKTLAPIQEKRAVFLKDKNKVLDILEQGAKDARVLAQKTMAEVKEKVFGK